MNFAAINFDEQVQFDRSKFMDVVHYVCAKVPVAELGRVRLHKILYFVDMLHFTATHRPLTGVEYRKQPFGPAARHLVWALQELREKGVLEVKRRDYFGFPKDDFIALQPFDSSRLSTRELQLIDDVVDFVSGKSIREFSELSPYDAWEAVAMGERIPYFTAFNLYPVEITDEDVAWGKALACKIVAERDGK